MPGRAEPLLSDVLRAATAEAHERLETALDLLAAPLSQTRFLHVLEGFHGFHEAWEPAMARQAACAPMMADRRRLDLLRADLRGLGRSDAEIDALQACPAAAALCADEAVAKGSLYVMEGSTLGGQVIGRALADASWAPSEGLRYFTPYGAQTGARWRAFKVWLNETPQEAWPAAAVGAVATFDLLRVWLTERSTGSAG